MALKESSRFCQHCGLYRLARRERPNHILHFLITALSCGLWLIIWVALGLIAWANPWFCSYCGKETDGLRRKPIRNLKKFIFLFGTVLLVFGGLAMLSYVQVGKSLGNLVPPMLIFMLILLGLCILARPFWVRKRKEAEEFHSKLRKRNDLLRQKKEREKTKRLRTEADYPAETGAEDEWQ